MMLKFLTSFFITCIVSISFIKKFYFIELIKICSWYTVGNVRKFTKFLCNKGNVKFDDNYNVCEYKGIFKLRKMY